MWSLSYYSRQTSVKIKKGIQKKPLLEDSWSPSISRSKMEVLETMTAAKFDTVNNKDRSKKGHFDFFS
jgi:hypothetical protein